MTGPDEPTTRGDFPGGFPGDKHNAFGPVGRTREQQDLFDYIRRLTHLYNELEPLKSGALVNLYVSSQQYAYARTTKGSSVVVVFNNDNQPAVMNFDVSPVGLRNSAILHDRLGVSKEV